jgi:hypothetical protein
MIMKQNAFRAWGLALGVFVLAAGGGRHDGLNLLVEQIRALGTRQWLGLMAESMVPHGLVPAAERIARLIPTRTVSTVSPSGSGSHGMDTL